jgi:hypothetical protein
VRAIWVAADCPLLDGPPLDQLKLARSILWV